MTVAVLEEKIAIQKIHCKGLNLSCSNCRTNKGDRSVKKVLYFRQENFNRTFFCEQCATAMLFSDQAQLTNLSLEPSAKYLDLVQGLQLFNPQDKDYLPDLEARVCRILLIIDTNNNNIKLHILHSLYNARYGYLSKDQLRNYLRKLDAAGVIKAEKVSGKIVYAKTMFSC